MAVHCKRCWRIFKNQEQLDSHLTVATSNICDLQLGHPPAGITPEQEKHLRSRKKTSPNQSEADRWKDIYKLLFPNEEIPSPCKLIELAIVFPALCYQNGSQFKVLGGGERKELKIYGIDFEPLQEEAAMSPDSRDIANYEDYIRRELPRLVRSNIEEAVRREMQPLEASLISNLVEIVQDCQDRVFRSYRETRGVSGELQMPTSIDAEATVSSTPPENMGGSNSGSLDRASHPQSNFIDTIFEPPPHSSESISTTLAERDSRGNLQIQSNDVFLSDSGYSSEQLQLCGRLGPCNCGTCYVRDREDSGMQEVGNGNLRWGDWTPYLQYGT
jgi:hypothetical protein